MPARLKRTFAKRDSLRLAQTFRGEPLESRVCMDVASSADEFVLAAANRSLVPPASSFQSSELHSLAAPAPAVSPSNLVSATSVPPRMTLSGPPQAVIRGGDAVFTVTLSSIPGLKTIRVRYETADGGARAGVHYTKTTGYLEFTGTDTSKTVAVPTIPNSLSRDPKSDFFFLKLSSPTNAKITNSSATATIAPPVSGIVVSKPSILEGNAGATTMQFAVTLATPNGATVSVDYATADGTATTADNDYTATRGTLVFAPGETTKTVDVSVVGDTKQEVDESFRLLLSNPINAKISDAAFGIGTIRNDDGTTTDPAGFQITIDYATSIFGPVPKAVRDACQWAAERWSQVITGDLPSVDDPDVGITDDFRITVTLGLLGQDAGSNVPGGTLANAAPLRYRTAGTKLPWLGIAGVDPADADSPELKGILLHEFGHALGFTPGLDAYKNLVVGTGFTGANALREYRSIFSQSAAKSVPLETGGGSGTAGAHWSEAVFGSELMTGYVDSVMQLSRVTVGLMNDIGYQVNYLAADAYTPAALRSGLQAGAAGIAAITAPTAMRTEPLVGIARSPGTAAAYAEVAGSNVATPSVGNANGGSSRQVATPARRTAQQTVTASLASVPRQVVFAALGRLG